MKPLIVILSFVVWATGSLPAAADARITGHDTDVRLDPAAGRIEVLDRIATTGTGSLKLLLGKEFEVTSVEVNGRKVSPRRDGIHINIPLGNATDAVLFIGYNSYIGTLDNDTAGQSPAATIGRSGSYLPADSLWLASQREHTADYRIRISTPLAQRALVPGRLLSEYTLDGRHWAEFNSEVPEHIPPLFAGPFKVKETQHKGIRIRTYFHPSLAPLSATYLMHAARHIDTYTDQIGDYPFSSFSIISGVFPVGLGYPGLTYMGTQVLRLPFIPAGSLRHEVLHNWWGNGVYANYETGNWGEGLTTYLSDYAAQAERGTSAARDQRLRWLRNYAALPSERDQAVRAFTSKSHDASQVIGYDKTAFIFHMLRQQLGDDAFNTGLKQFWKDHTFKTAGWKDLQQAFETASGSKLKRFFSQWLDRRGAPDLRLTNHTVAKAKDGYRTRFTLRQNGPAYLLAVPVEITTATGLERRVVRLARRLQTFSIITKSQPRELAIDPGFDLFRRLASSEAPPILRDVTLNPKTVTVLLATDEAGLLHAEGLARRLLDTRLHLVDPDDGATSDAPLLVIGLDDAVAKFLKHHGFPATPKSIAGQGSARAWVGTLGAGTNNSGTNNSGTNNSETLGAGTLGAGKHKRRPFFIVSAANNRALRSVLRPLPHYGGQSYVTFNGRKAIRRGVWPTGNSPLRVSLKPVP